MTLDNHLQRINKKFVSPEDKVKKLYNDNLRTVLDCLVDNMKATDEVFAKLYKTPHFQGSSYENLRVGCRDEFDINLELELPVNYDDIEIETYGTSPGFARIKLGDFKRNVTDKVRRTVEKWVDDQRYLYRDAVQKWLKSTVDRALETCQRRDLFSNLGMITRRESGPAVTICVTSVGGLRFSVDLVPVLIFKNNDWPSGLLRNLEHLPRNIETSILQWSVVPKNPRDTGKKDPTQWRMSFYPYEKALMNGIDGMKLVNRLLKLLRDRQGWPSLSSYYIKTLFLWDLDKEGEDFWVGKSYGTLFLHMLQVFEEYLEKRCIPFYWDSRCNLVEHLPSAELERIHGSLKNLRKKLLQSLGDPNALKNAVNFMFKCQEESVNTLNGERLVLAGSPEAVPETQQSSAGWSSFGVALGVAAVGLVIGGAAESFFANRRRN